MNAAPISSKAAIRLILDEFRDQRWQDVAGTAGALQQAWAAGQPLSAAITEAFVLRNHTTTDAVVAAVTAKLEGVVIADELPALIEIDEIDSFAKVTEIDAAAIKAVPRPLTLSEAEVKRTILEVLGETEPDNDWGGERSDAFTTNVRLRGRRIATSFVLKGPSGKGVLTPRMYGKNGDQIQRSFTQPASLHVIQTNDRLAPSVRELASGLVHQRRKEGDPYAVASLWDATDTIRLLVAHGFIDPSDGKILR